MLKIDYKYRAALVRGYDKFTFNNRANFTPAQKNIITRRYNYYKKFGNISFYYTDKKTLNRMSERGYTTTPKGVFIDDLRDYLGNKLPGSSARLLNHDIIKISLRAEGFKQTTRIDYIYNFLKNEKIEFLKEPEKFTINLIKRIRVLHYNFDIKTLNSKPTRQQLRFQMGAYGTHTAAMVDALNYYIHNRKKNDTFIRELTGLRFIKFIPINEKRGKKKNAKKKTKRKSRNA